MRKPILIIVGVVLVLLMTLAVVLKVLNKTYPVTVQTNTSSIRDASIQFNGEEIKPAESKGNQATYYLKKGEYTIRVSQDGYKPFGTTFSVTSGQSVSINIQLDLDSDPTITSPTQIKGLGSDITISDVHYFYNKTWAVMSVSTANTDPAILAARYSPAQHSWSIVLGPGTLFSVDDTAALPSQVASYLNTSAVGE